MSGTDIRTQSGGWVNLIHETLIRSKRLDDAGKAQPYWPTLWDYIEANKNRAARREQPAAPGAEWKERRGLARLLGLAGWSGLHGFGAWHTAAASSSATFAGAARSVFAQSLVLAAVPRCRR